MFNKSIFDKAVNEMVQIMNKFKETNELHAVRKDLGGNFMRIFKDSLFEYNDGIILLERFYKDKHLKFDMVNFPYVKDEDKELIQQLEELSESMPATNEMNQEQIQEYSSKINQLCSDIKNIKPDYREDQIKYIDTVFGKIITKNLSEMNDEEILSRSLLAVSLALSMYESIFLIDEFHEGVSIMSIENDAYVDLVIVPYSAETIEDDTQEEVETMEEETEIVEEETKIIEEEKEKAEV